jgi:peptidoglycan/xylan/chitin deacetylase (PgdA/CDA1 family)
MKRALASCLWRADRWMSRQWLKLRAEKSGLLVFLFHSWFDNEREIERELIDPQQRITRAHFRRFIEHFLRHGYRFVSPSDVLDGLEPSRRYGLITFDDGYFNNHRAVPLLQEYRVPAVFYISTDHVQQNKCFWWDVLYREGRRAGRSAEQIRQAGQRFKRMTNPEVEQALRREFGSRALAPLGDLDRPFTPAELRDFARQPFVFLGNHTCEHAVLTNYPPEQARAQIVGAQDALEEMTGVRPGSIAYPNGDYSPAVIALAREAGLRLGISCDPHKNHLPLDANGDEIMRLGRFSLTGTDSIERQCDLCRSDLQLYQRLRRRLHR